MTDWENYLKENGDRFLQELLAFLSIPSISALPEHAPDIQRAAEWLAGRARAAGLENVRLMPTGGPPIVYADWLHAPGKPTALIYGHYDTQPADPLEEWTTPPFEPEVRDGRIYARGASDDKGNLLVPVLAVEAMLKTLGELPVNLKFLFEGEEEILSPHLPAFLERYRELLSCDVALSADGVQWGEDQPSLLVGLKGACALQVDVHGPATDLHSGMYGGAVQNPIHALVQLLDSLRDPEGRILVEGFYKDVRPLSDEERAQIKAVPFDETRYREQIGLDELFGEPGFTAQERLWARPTLEINGIWGGFQGEGVKTVIPREAHAKITCRLVADQEPVEIVDLIAAHLENQAPPGVRISVQRNPLTALPYLMPADHPVNQAAKTVLQELYQADPYYIRLGGSLPICPLIHSNLNAYTVMFAFGLDDEKQHAPDEFFRVRSFTLGQRAYGKLLQKLGQMSLVGR